MRGPLRRQESPGIELLVRVLDVLPSLTMRKSRKHLWLVLCSFMMGTAACSTLGLPALGQIGGPSAEDFPDVGAVVLEDEATLSYEMAVPEGKSRRQVVAVLDHRRRIKVLRPDGLTEAKVRLPLDAYSTVTQVRARSATPDGLTREMSQRATHIVSREDPAERAGDVVDLSFHVPGAVVGGIIEYRYKRIFLDPLAVPLWTFGTGQLPVVHAEFGVHSGPGIQIDLRHGEGDHSIDRAPQRREVDAQGSARLVFFVNDQPPFFNEPHGVHLAHLAPWVATTLRQVRDKDHLMRYESWAQVTQAVRRRLDAVDEVGLEGSVRHRLVAARQALQPLRGRGLGIRKPQSAADLKQGSVACSRDTAAYARDTLLGSSARPTVVLLTGPQAPPFSEDFPSLTPFEHVALEIDVQPDLPDALRCSGPLWRQDFGCHAWGAARVLVDLNCAGCALGIVPSGYEGSRALRLEADGNVTWFTVNQGSPDKHSLWLESRYVLDVEGNIKGRMTGEARGSVAARWRESVLHPEWEASRESHAGPRSTVLRLLLGDGVAPRLEGLTSKNVDTPESPLGFDAKLVARAERGIYGHTTVSAEQLMGSSIPDYWSGQRRGAAQIDGPSWREETTEINLPVAWQAAVPPPVRLVSDVLEYAAEYRQIGRKLSYLRRVVIKTPIVDAESWYAFHEQFERIRAAEAAKVRFEIRE